MKYSSNKPCPCHSGRKFKGCCRPILQGQPAVTPEALMRSRYAAYATGNVEHIVRTTHPSGPQFQHNNEKWMAEIATFCETNRFVSLEIHEHSVTNSIGRVHFTAHLQSGRNPVSIVEKSLFYLVDERWLYWGQEETD